MLIEHLAHFGKNAGNILARQAFKDKEEIMARACDMRGQREIMERKLRASSILSFT